MAASPSHVVMTADGPKDLSQMNTKVAASRQRYNQPPNQHEDDNNEEEITRERHQNISTNNTTTSASSPSSASSSSYTSYTYTQSPPQSPQSLPQRQPFLEFMKNPISQSSSAKEPPAQPSSRTSWSGNAAEDREIVDELLPLDVVDEINKIRKNPKMWSEQHLVPLLERFEGNVLRTKSVGLLTVEGKAAVEECVSVLEGKTGVGRKSLRLCEGLSRAAELHALDLGGNGIRGHMGSDDSTPETRAAIFGQFEGGLGEAIAYGCANAVEIVRALVVDDGVPARGHRTIILDERHTCVGVAVASHVSHRWVCVQLFAHGWEDGEQSQWPVRPAMPAWIASTREDEHEGGYAPSSPRRANSPTTSLRGAGYNPKYASKEKQNKAPSRRAVVSKRDGETQTTLEDTFPFAYRLLGSPSLRQSFKTMPQIDPSSIVSKSGDVKMDQRRAELENVAHRQAIALRALQRMLRLPGDGANENVSKSKSEDEEQRVIARRVEIEKKLQVLAWLMQQRPNQNAR